MKIIANDSQQLFSKRSEQSAKAAPTATVTQLNSSAHADKAAAMGNPLSNDAVQLTQAAEQLAQRPEVDMAKVASLQQALEDGSFELDLDAISQGLLDQHGE